MKNLLTKTQRLVIIFTLLIFLFPSCNNEELYVNELESQIIEEEPPNTESEIFEIELANDVIETNQNISVEIKVFENDLRLPSNFSVQFTMPQFGALEINDNATPEDFSDDSFTYTPNIGYFGVDTFDYTVCDTNNETDNCSTATVNITVKEVIEDIAGELKAFPSAYGAGSNATGGRGGRVLYVTTTEDTGQEGSLRWALSQRYPRTVVFSVGGEFELTQGRLKLSNPEHGNLTVAGQTAPGDGVTITGNYLLMSAIDNVILRYIRFRGVENASNASATDLITGVECTNIILDHCSGSWATDEIFSFTSLREGGFSGSITTQRTLFAEMDPSHSTASINGGYPPEDATNTGDYSWNNNFVYSISHRFPNVLGDGRFEIKNNVIYNWKYRLTAAYYGAEVNQQNNFYKAGPATIAQGLGQGDGLIETLNRVGNSGVQPDIYARGNLVYPDLITDPNADNWIMWRWFLNSPGKSREETITTSLRLDSEPQALGFELPLLPADEAYLDVLNDVGANKSLNADGTYTWNTDELDRLFINDALDDTGSSRYRTPDEWILPPLNNPNNNTPYADDDKDGMPNTWETMHNLDPNNKEDGNLDSDGDGYTNLEEFLNQVDK